MTNLFHIYKMEADALHPDLQKWLNQDKLNALVSEEMGDKDSEHFAKQSQRMQDAINLHLRKGKSYDQAVAAARVHVKEDLDESGPFSYGAKVPKKGSVAYNAMMKRKEQEKGKQPMEPKDQMVGVAKLTKEEHDIIEANEYHKIAVKHLKDLHRKDATPAQKEYAKKMNKRALEAAKMSDPIAAKKHYMGEDVNEAKDSEAMKGGKLQGHMVNFKPKGKLSGDEVVKKVNDIAKSLQSNHPDKVHKGAYSHGYGEYSFNEKHRGPKTGYVVVKSKEHLDAVKQLIKSHGAAIQEGVEELDELKMSTLRSYVDKAKAENLPGKGGNRGVALLTPGTRDKGVHRAVERMRKMKEELEQIKENDIVTVVDGARSDRKYNDADHAHNSLSKMVGYQKAKKAELYVNGQKTKHYEIGKRYDDFEPKKLSESLKQIDELKKSTIKSYLSKTVDPVYGIPKTKEKISQRMKGISKAHQRIVGNKPMSEEEYMGEAMVHPMGLHVMPVKVQGKTKYKVHAVGKHLSGGIKVGEHLSDTDLDDATEMGAKIKHIKEEAVDKTIELHDDFILDIPSELKYGDYIDAAKSYSEDPAEQIMIADEFYRNKDESLVIEAFTRSDIESKIEAHRKAGSKVGMPKYSTKNGKPYAEYTVTDKEGSSTRYIHHGSTRRVERQ